MGCEGEISLGGWFGGERIDKDERFERGGRERKRKFAVIFCPLSNQRKTVEIQWILRDSEEIRVGCDVIW